MASRSLSASLPWMLLGLALLGTWIMAAFAITAGRGVPLALTVVPIAGFAAGFAAAREAVRQGYGRMVAGTAIGLVILGSALGLWSMVDADYWRAFVVFIAMMATVCPTITGIAAGAWAGAYGGRA